MQHALHRGARHQAIEVRSQVDAWAERLQGAGVEQRGRGGAIDFVNGKPSGDASIAKSSQSPGLDEAALAYLRRVKLRSSGTETAPEVKKMLVDVEFVRDSIVTLGKKPCAELSADIAHFRKTNPTLELTKMRLYKMSLGMVALSGDLKNVPAMVKLSKIMPAAYSATALACESKPEAVYLQELLHSLTAAAK